MPIYTWSQLLEVKLYIVYEIVINAVITSKSTPFNTFRSDLLLFDFKRKLSSILYL